LIYPDQNAIKVIAARACLAGVLAIIYSKMALKTGF
jgi:hypothetical protein